MNANAESPPGGPAQEVADLDRAWLRGLIHDLLVEAGAAQPDVLTAQVVLLYDGATMSARLDRNPAAATTARAATEALLTAAGIDR